MAFVWEKHTAYAALGVGVGVTAGDTQLPRSDGGGCRGFTMFLPWNLKNLKSRERHWVWSHCPSTAAVVPGLACSHVKRRPGDGAKDSPQGSAPWRCWGTLGTEPPPQHPPPCPIPSRCTPGCHLSPGVPRSSSLFQVVGSHQVILWDDPDHVVELSDPPAIHVVLLGRHSRRDGDLVPGQGTRLRSLPLAPGSTESSPPSPTRKYPSPTSPLVNPLSSVLTPLLHPAPLSPFALGPAGHGLGLAWKLSV